ncbi:MAG: NADH-quinone oxidoreductase subunit N [Actinobacteria bacterium]|nr:NADH-quinone oxidoreductase subunit N [Actinomycetota bacterium]
MNAPKLDYALLAPILIVLGGALIGVLVEAFLGRARRTGVQIGLALITVAAAFIQVIRIRHSGSSGAAVLSVSIDGAGIYIQGTILLLSLVGLLLIADTDNFTAQASAVPGSTQESAAIIAGKQQTEIFPLTLFAIAGMLLFPVATDLVTLFVALEMLSLPLYLMAGLSRRRRLLSQELGIALLSVGLLFKVGAVPFHSWTPDVYQGAPTPITGFMAACTKAAAFGATLRIFYVALDGASWSWKPMIAVVAVITMFFGAIAAISQRDVKRMLAFSSIAHAGFILTAVVSLNNHALSAALFYFVAYGFATIGAFGIVTLVRDSAGEVGDLNRWVGLGKKSPLTAAIFGLFLLSFGGIPLTAGFIGKFAIFSAAYESGNIYLAVAGVLSSAVAIFFYLRVIVMLFFQDPTNDSVSVVIPSAMTRLAITICAIVTIVLGVFPSLILNATNTFALFTR